MFQVRRSVVRFVWEIWLESKSETFIYPYTVIPLKISSIFLENVQSVDFNIITDDSILSTIRRDKCQRINIFQNLCKVE